MYIVLEGIIGSWKTTQAQKLGEYFRSIWKEVVLVREPGSTPIAEDIRYLAQWKEWKNEVMHPLTNAYLYAAARAQTLQTVVKPALEDGKIVISDRSFLSSCTIQWEAQWLGIDTIFQINSEAIDWILPDIILYLDIDIDLALGRTSDIFGDKFEKEGKKFYEAIIRWYQKCEKLEFIKDIFVRIDANGTEEEVSGSVLKIINTQS